MGTGGLCGSAFLNYRFEEHIKNRLGKTRFDEMKVKKNKTWQMGLKYFEEFVKRNFNEDEHQEVNVPCVTILVTHQFPVRRQLIAYQVSRSAG